MRFVPILCVLLLAGPVAALSGLEAPPGPPRIEKESGPLGLPIELEEIFANVSNETSVIAGQNLTREDVRVRVDMEFRKIDLDLIGAIFGGGTFEAQARIGLTLDLRAISFDRIKPILEERAGMNITLPLERTSLYITADEMRTLLAGEALRAFQDEQEAATRNLIESSFPDLTVLSTRFTWTNTTPAINMQGDVERGGIPLLTEPPMTLDATVELQFIHVESLVGILDGYRARKAALARDPSLDAAEDAQKAELERLRAENEGPIFDRSAFSILGITQLLVLEMDPGWDLDVAMRLPQGYTFEYASADVGLSKDYSRATAATYARLAGQPVENPVAVSLSNRYLVTVTMLGAVFLVGFLLRAPTLIVSNWTVARAAKRRLERIDRIRRNVPAESALDATSGK